MGVYAREPAARHAMGHGPASADHHEGVQQGTPASGYEALDRADWVAAQAAFEAAIADRPNGSAYEGLALAHYWQCRLPDALRAMERAYTQFRKDGDPGRAAWAALWIAGQYLRVQGNHAAAMTSQSANVPTIPTA
jgi:hypothetical protein